VTRVIQRIAAVWGLLLLAACATEAAVAPASANEYLDEVTGATITTVEKPLVFARERRDLAANARDYVTVAATSINRSGKIHYCLIAYVWSTVDTRGRPLDSDNKVIVISVDDRRIHLTTSGRSAEVQGISKPLHEPPGPSLAPAVFETDLQTLRFLAAARNVSLQVGDNSLAPSYVIWDDERESLAQFVRFLNGER
jgi:hypothetical protein